MSRILVLLFMPVSFSMTVPVGAQETVKFPVGVSSKVLGYGHLGAAWRRIRAISGKL